VPQTRLADVARVAQATAALRSFFKPERLPTIVRGAMPGLGERSVLETFAMRGAEPVPRLVDALRSWARVGGRWNPPDRPGRRGFGALYLNQSLAASRENARRYVRLRAGVVATFDDIATPSLPDLQHYTVVWADFTDAVTTGGIAELGSPHPIRPRYRIRRARESRRRPTLPATRGLRSFRRSLQPKKNSLSSIALSRRSL
jgi:hypothetical protein